MRKQVTSGRAGRLELEWNREKSTFPGESIKEKAKMEKVLDKTAHPFRRAMLTLVLAAAVYPAGADDASLATPHAGGGADSSAAYAHSWELPAKSVRAVPGGLRENETVGRYGQPRWTTRRLFSEVRTYVIPEGQAETEYWLFVSAPSSDAVDAAEAAGEPDPDPSVKQMFELEMGLGHRLQADLYLVYVKDVWGGENTLDATKFELRYALADWGKLPANPTLYLEWEQAGSGYDAVEGKLLLCDAFSGRGRWASNLVWEEKLDGVRERGLEWNSAVAWAVKDEVLSLGAELALADVSELKDPDSDERTHDQEAALGPSVRLYPTPHAHVILTAFFGFNGATDAVKAAGILGWEF